ncbi:MAG: DUF3224 domain-containing protein [Proteobacteria bacterium]|nr:DUF3224 domain-containing protein [Pseudomonadota bacterium]
MKEHATGSFDVKITAQKHDSQIARAANFDRRTIDKRFHGPLEATGKGEMIATSTEVKESAAYVALERVSGRLNGRSGSFVLQHMAIMNRGKPQMTVTVVPDSGSGELRGLTGAMTITVGPDGAHSYDFSYSLEARKD